MFHGEEQDRDGPRAGDCPSGVHSSAGEPLGRVCEDDADEHRLLDPDGHRHEHRRESEAERPLRSRQRRFDGGPAERRPFPEPDGGAHEDRPEADEQVRQPRASRRQTVVRQRAPVEIACPDDQSASEQESLEATQH